MAAIDSELINLFQNNNNGVSNHVHHYQHHHLPNPIATNINGPLVSSDDSESESHANIVLELKGYLNKWTNYIHGWQPRFIVFKDGTLSYYKSEEDSDFGCRGAISVFKATVKVRVFVYIYICNVVPLNDFVGKFIEKP